MFSGARSTLWLSDPYHFQVSVTRSHATQLLPQPTADINCDCRTLQVVCSMISSRPRAWHLHRGARAHTLHIRSRCAYVARDAHRGHQPFRHIYLTPHTRTRLRLCVPWRAGVALGLHGAMGVREARKALARRPRRHQDDGLLRCHAGSVHAMSPAGSTRNLASIARVFTACITFGSAPAKLLQHTAWWAVEGVTLWSLRMRCTHFLTC